QEQIPLSDGSALRLTVARYYTPSGRCIQKPYDKGVDQYSQDLIERIHHGEMEESDSIHFKESLKYHTKSGRVVYGGGGIMPDIFVPADTTGISEYFIKLTQKGIIYQYAYAYADREREKLNKLSNADEFNSYLGKQDIFNGLIRYAVKKGLPRDPAGFKESELVIKTQLKASIARNIIGEEGYFPIIKQIDTTLLKAIEISKQNLLVEEVGLKR
ncbi:Carboxy-terminal processing protease, partial [hydrothermal vent metagenome]